jgi:replication factor C subunit 1
MFTTVYRPKKVDHIVGHKNLNLPFIQWLLDWSPEDKKKKCALVSSGGLCGIGKNLFVELMLKKHNCNIIHLALDDERDKKYMIDTIHPLLHTKKTFDGQDNVLVVSDIDCGCDYGFISSLTECIKESKIPIVCICNNKYDQNIKPILSYCVDFKMTKPSYQEVYALVYNVVINEKIRIKESEIRQLYDQSNGDIRFILNTLQLGSRSGFKNTQSSNVFDSTSKLLSMDETLASKYDLYWMSNDLHPLMVQENYINSTLNTSDSVRKMENLAYSAEALSCADIFESCVHMTNWELGPYVAISTIQAAAKCNKKGMIKFPQFLGKVATINKNRREKRAASLAGPNTTPEPKDKKPKDKKPKDKKPKDTNKPKEPKKEANKKIT